jgi:hypothetical protein
MEDAPTTTPLLQKHPEWVLLLTSYLPSTGEPAESAWKPRLRSLEGLGAEKLSSIHGKLIAHGLLKFEFIDKQGGMAYQVTSEGLAALATLNRPVIAEAA